MHRVGLPEIPASLVDWFPCARSSVSRRCDELLNAEVLRGPSSADEQGQTRS
jgi:hypothetical protein